MNKPETMNKLGVWVPVRDKLPGGWQERVLARLAAIWRQRIFLLLVVVPSLLATFYYGALASDQYESEADYVVRSADSPRATTTGLGQVLGIGATLGQPQTEAYGVADYLSSHDAVLALQQRFDLVSMFRRPGVDPLSRIWSGNPSAEALLKYYRKQVSVHFDPDTGITTLNVRAFEPADARDIAGALVALGEQRVNEMNKRTYEAAVAAARTQFEASRDTVSETQAQITAFRQNNQDIDPQESGAAQIKLVTDLDARVAQSRATLNAMRGQISPDSPQVRAQREILRSLEGQLAAYRGKLSGDKGAIAQRLGQYEALLLQQKFAAEQFQSAAAVYQKAQEDASKQQLFIVEVVKPNLPQQSMYPKRLQAIATVILGSLLIFAIGWLIAAGVREHSA